MSSHDTVTAPGRRRPAARISPVLLWFAVVGGTVAWLVHLGDAWAVMELACISPTDGPWVDNSAGSPGTVAWVAVAAGTALPWLVGLAALVACLVVRRRHRRLLAAGDIDELAGERVGLLLTIGIYLDLLALAAITGGIVGLLTLEACG